MLSPDTIWELRDSLKNTRLRKLEGVFVPHSQDMHLPTFGKVALLGAVLT